MANQGISAAIGSVEQAGHWNASCEGWPQCTDISNEACQCFNYGWDQPSLHAFVLHLLAANVTSMSVWRSDITPPPGTTAALPDWFIAELAFFRQGAQVQV